jgi:opacity protein-like surface antigen
LITRGGIDKREYSRDHLRDGAYWTAGQYARVFFTESNHEFTIGAQYRGGSPKKRHYAYDGWELSTRLLFKLPYGFEVAPFASLSRDSYHGPATALETRDREDEHLRLGSGLTYRINESWSLELGYRYGKNTSTSNLYDYDQHTVNSGIAWSF